MNKQIEEMAKVIDDRLIEARGWLGSMNKGEGYWIAQKLIDLYQPKINENEVVISKKEYKNLKKELKEMEEQRDEQAYITEELIQEKHLWTEQARKKMAKEILEYIEQNFSEEWSTVDCLYDVHEWISNTFDIDLGDENED